jgi:hypothetical protein
VKLWLFGPGWVLRVLLPVVLCSLSSLSVLKALWRILWWLSRLLTPLPPSSSGLGLRNCMELELVLEEEPTPLSCCPVDKCRGRSGKRSLDRVL